MVLREYSLCPHCGNTTWTHMTPIGSYCAACEGQKLIDPEKIEAQLRYDFLANRDDLCSIENFKGKDLVRLRVPNLDDRYKFNFWVFMLFIVLIPFVVMFAMWLTSHLRWVP